MKAICKECKYRGSWWERWGGYAEIWTCYCPEVSPTSPITGKAAHPFCSDINGDGECKHFVKRGWLW